MKLPFDQNLSTNLPRLLADVYDGSLHVREAGLLEAEDSAVWDYARHHGLVIVSRDSDIQARSLLYGSPPKFIWLRDYFLMRCHDQPALRGVFTELTPPGALTKEGLRRALVEPAKKLGYRFEDDALVDEMVGAVQDERAALPLLAFAVSRLWEKRDRERKLLTRAAYEEIGGVAGALARHAEAVMDRIGAGQDVVREVFRNLVTAQGTRAVVDRDELLSVFPEKRVAEGVLRELIDARLVTSYEVQGREGEASRHRVEVVHESLLKAWPRLVWWQTQDEEGAVLRDQLKQAAHLWDEKGRTDDLLWTGTAYQEFALWRGRYSGALTALEEDFVKAMAGKAQRHRRLVRLAVATAFVLVTAIAIAIGFSRVQVTRARDRAEAGKLLALGRTEIDRYPTAALAYVRKSMELADTPEARRFAVEVLWRGPVARILPADQIAKQLGVIPATAADTVGSLAMSPDGSWLATQSLTNRDILLFRRDGGPPRRLPRRPTGNAYMLGFSPRSDLLITGGSGESLWFWSLRDLREIRSVELGGSSSWGEVAGGNLFTFTQMLPEDRGPLIRAWPLPEGEPKVLGTLDLEGASGFALDPTGSRLAIVRDRTLRLRPLNTAGPATERVLGNFSGEIGAITFFPKGDRLATVSRSGEISLWAVGEGAMGLWRILWGTKSIWEGFAVDHEGLRLSGLAPLTSRYVWNLGDPPDAEPAVLRLPEPGVAASDAFDPNGQWLISSNGSTVAFWPLTNPSVRMIRFESGSTWSMSFTPDGRWLASCPIGEPARLWPMNPADGAVKTLTPVEPCWVIAAHPAGASILVGGTSGRVLLFPIAGTPPRQLLPGWEGGSGTMAVAFDSQGRRVVASPLNYAGLRDPKRRVLRVVDLESGQDRVFSVAHLTDESWPGFEELRFAPDGSLFAAGQRGVCRLLLPSDPGGTVSSETVYAADRARINLSRDGRYILACVATGIQRNQFDELVILHLIKHTSRRITTHGRRLFYATFDPSGHIIVTGDIDGIVRAGPASGEEPHLLLGPNAGMVTAVAVSPDSRWIASVTDEGIHLWPMPDMKKPPLHTLSHAELMMKLDALTNLRVVPDAASSTGWKLDIGPFPGWAVVPDWHP